MTPELLQDVIEYTTGWWTLELDLDPDEPGEARFWTHVYHEMWKEARKAFGVKPDPESVRQYWIGTHVWVRYTSGVAVIDDTARIQVAPFGRGVAR